MRKFIILFQNSPLAPNGLLSNGIIFTKEEAEKRINELNEADMVNLEIMEISSIPVKLITNKVSIV